MRLRLILVGVLLAFVMIFALQNSEVVELRMLFWQVAMPRSLLVFLMLLTGVVLGWVLSALFRLARAAD